MTELKELGSLGEPLYLDVATTLREAGLNDITLVGGRYGFRFKGYSSFISIRCI